MTEAQVTRCRKHYDNCNNCPTDDEFEPDRKLKGTCFRAHMHNVSLKSNKGVELEGTITLEETGKVIQVYEVKK